MVDMVHPPKKKSDLIDQIERIREELLVIQRSMENLQPEPEEPTSAKWETEMTVDGNSPMRPWREIAREIAQQTSRDKIPALEKELDKALEEQHGIDPA
jgi:hypothetical protein